MMLLSCLKGGTLGFTYISGTATGDVDVFCLADTIFVKSTVDGIAVYGQRYIGGLVLVAVGVVGLLVETGAASGFLFAGILTFDQDVATTAAVVCVMNTGFYITIQTYHGISSFLNI